MTPKAGTSEVSAVATGERRRPRSTAAVAVAGGAAFLAFIVLAALGTWQVHRLAWKRDLIARVEARINAPPTPPPSPDAWAKFDDTNEVYRHVRVAGHFLPEPETRVQAVTMLGGGFWALTPFQTDDGFVVLINRGFIGRDVDAARASPPAGETSVTGLLRASEPKGAFLHDNDAKADRWYSRDVLAIGAARGLSNVAPYFIDADAAANGPGLPVGGLTVVSFPNNHLVYALTWYGLAIMLVVGLVWVVIDERRQRILGR